MRPHLALLTPLWAAALAPLLACNGGVKVGDDSDTSLSGFDLTLLVRNDDAAFDPTGWTEQIAYTYDDSGDVLTAQDTGNVGAGVIAWTATWTYATPGSQRPDTQDYVDDGGEDLWAYTYDGEDRPLTVSIDEGADGSANYVTAWTYNDKGFLASEQYTDDLGEDAAPDYLTTYVYNGDGLLAAEETDLYLDEEPDTRWTYTYDDAGNRALSEWDGGADGTINEVLTSTFDGHGNVLTTQDDKYADGSVDVTTTNTWDQDSNQLTEQVANADGALTESDAWTYDADGNVLTEQQDLDAEGALDGTIDATAAYTWVAWSNP